jgi:hypothetical protein
MIYVNALLTKVANVNTYVIGPYSLHNTHQLETLSFDFNNDILT